MAISSLKPGKSISSVVKAVRDLISSKKPEFLPHLSESLGSGVFYLLSRGN